MPIRSKVCCCKCRRTCFRLRRGERASGARHGRGRTKKGRGRFGTGYHGPRRTWRRHPEKPVGLVYMALSDGVHTWVRRMDPPGRVKNRSWVRDRAAHYALDMVRRYLAGMPVEGTRCKPRSRLFKEMEGKRYGCWAVVFQAHRTSL